MKKEQETIEQEFRPTEVSQQKHKGYPGWREGRKGPDKRVKADYLTLIERQSNKEV